MAGLQGHIQNTIRMILTDHIAQSLETVIIRCHYRAADSQVSSGNCLVDIFSIFIHLNTDSLFSCTVFISYYHTAIFLYRTNDLLGSSSDGATCNQYTGALLKMFSCLIFLFCLLL